MFGARAKIVDPEGRELPPYEIGELVYQGESLMSRLLGAQEGDRRDDLRRLVSKPAMPVMSTRTASSFIKDRLKDMIVSGSENIYPAEVEAVLAGSPRP